MVTIEAIIERAEDGTYCVYCKNDIFSGAGVSIDDAKADMKEQMEFKITGINQKQLWSYLNGTKPRKTQSDRIEIGFKKLYEDMYSIFA